MVYSELWSVISKVKKTVWAPMTPVPLKHALMRAPAINFPSGLIKDSDSDPDSLTTALRTFQITELLKRQDNQPSILTYQKSHDSRVN